MKKQLSTEQFASQQSHLNNGSDNNNSIVPGSAENLDDVTDSSPDSTDLSESGVTRRDGRCRKILDIIG